MKHNHRPLAEGMLPDEKSVGPPTFSRAGPEHATRAGPKTIREGVPLVDTGRPTVAHGLHPPGGNGPGTNRVLKEPRGLPRATGDPNSGRRIRGDGSLEWRPPRPVGRPPGRNATTTVLDVVVLQTTRTESESNGRLRVPWLKRGSTRGDDGDHWSTTPPTRLDAERAWSSRWSAGPPEGHGARSRGAPPRVVGPPGKRRPVTNRISDELRLRPGNFGSDIRDGRETARRGLGFSEPRAGDPDHGWVTGSPEKTSSVDACFLADTSSLMDSTEHCRQLPCAEGWVFDSEPCTQSGLRLPQATGDPLSGGGAQTDSDRRRGLRDAPPTGWRVSPGPDGRPPTMNPPPAGNGDECGRLLVGSTNCGQSPPGHVRFIAYGEGSRETGGEVHRPWSLVDPDDGPAGYDYWITHQVHLVDGPPELPRVHPNVVGSSPPTWMQPFGPRQVASLLGAGSGEDREHLLGRSQFESVIQEIGFLGIRKNQEPESQCATALGAVRIGPSFALTSDGLRLMEGDA
jgi:hypothetical protein